MRPLVSSSWARAFRVRTGRLDLDLLALAVVADLGRAGSRTVARGELAELRDRLVETGPVLAVEPGLHPGFEPGANGDDVDDRVAEGVEPGFERQGLRPGLEDDRPLVGALAGHDGEVDASVRRCPPSAGARPGRRAKPGRRMIARRGRSCRARSASGRAGSTGRSADSRPRAGGRLSSGTGAGSASTTA